jgi:hypothetical protein
VEGGVTGCNYLQLFDWTAPLHDGEGERADEVFAKHESACQTAKGSTTHDAMVDKSLRLMSHTASSFPRTLRMWRMD